MCKELLLGTAVAPSHMYLFPLGTAVLSEQPVGSIQSKAANTRLYYCWNAIILVYNRGLTPIGTHFEPQRTSVRAGSQ